jgi:hypothetical protein
LHSFGTLSCTTVASSFFFSLKGRKKKVTAVEEHSKWCLAINADIINLSPVFIYFYFIFFFWKLAFQVYKAIPSNLFENFTKNKEKDGKLIDRKGRGLSCSIVSLLNSHYIFVVKQNPSAALLPISKKK